MSKLKPVQDKVILKVIKEDETATPSGLIIQRMYEQKNQEAVVVAVGPGITFDNGSRLDIELKPGDRVLFSKYEGTEITVDREDYLIIAYRDILAVL
jgi:chaperonin GroES